ncbi:hypoxia induced protein conserved region-domain-containing protein [Chiua virens]|nr:hypoxia induced protein conserved region-domain-containing protein [Chiua virens]
MSTSPLATPHTPSIRRATESYGERALRKFKEEPLVPIGTFATVGAFTMAVIKLRRRESRSLNYWMRMRVAAQAFTIAAVCAYCWGPGKEQSTQTVEDLQVKREQQFDKERKEFQDRLKVAETEWKETQNLAGDAKK